MNAHLYNKQRRPIASSSKSSIRGMSFELFKLQQRELLCANLYIYIDSMILANGIEIGGLGNGRMAAIYIE